VTKGVTKRGGTEEDEYQRRRERGTAEEEERMKSDKRRDKRAQIPWGDAREMSRGER